MPDSPADGESVPDAAALAALQAEAEAARRACVVSAIIMDGRGRVFVQHRAPNRPIFPGCWDIAGGHAEPGETLRDALAREIAEETGWRLRRILRLVDVVDWEVEQGGRVAAKREFSFLVEVDGDLAAPVIERENFTEYRWIGSSELDLLRENRAPGDDVLLRLVARGLALAAGSTDGLQERPR